MIRNGEILGGMYRILEEIGHGGTGVVYLADHLRLQKKVVVKKIKDHYAGQISARAEADILKNLHHTYLPQVYDFLQIGSTVYTVMEYVEGADLQYYLDQGHKFQEKTLLKWLLQLSEVLDYLHSQKPPILHSDIKPANIMITPQGNVCLIDFNISLDGEDTKDVRGISQWYAAPEQFEKVMYRLSGEKDTITLDARMDIYSLGATFYTLVTGYLPDPQQEQLVPVIYSEAPYSSGLKAVIHKAMQRQPGRRFHSASQMRRAVLNISRLDPLYRRYSKLQVLAVVLYGLCMISGILMVYYGNFQCSRAKWLTAYQDFYKANETQAEEEIISTGNEMLNEFRYKSYRKNHPEEKAEVLHAVGESYFRQKEFEEAVSYYEEAYETAPEETTYLQDYVISLVRNHQRPKAEKVLDNAGDVRVDQEALQLIQAEILIEEGKETEAVPILDKLEGSSNPTYMEHAALLAADIYREQKDYENETVVLKSATEASGSTNVLRRYGEALVNAFSESTRDVYQNYYLGEALECYKSLYQKANPSYEDKMNLALVRRMGGEYQESNEVLKLMKQEDARDYKIGMWMCYNYLDQARDDKDYTSVKGDLWYTYRETKNRYQREGGTDEEMEQLMEIMNQMEE